MSIETEIAYIRDRVDDMNIRGNANAITQATIVEKVSAIEKTLEVIKENSHAPNSCKDVSLLKEQITTLKEAKSLSKKQQAGIFTGIAAVIYAIAEILKGIFKS